MQSNDSSIENPNTSNQSAGDEWKGESRALLFEMGKIVDFDIVSARSKAGQFEFTYEEASMLFPLWASLPYKGKLMMWDLYNLHAGVYFINDTEKSFGAAGGKWVHFAHLQNTRLMRITPRESSEYFDFILWGMRRCIKDDLRLSTLTKSQYQEQIAKDRVPEEYLEIAIRDVSQVINTMFGKMHLIYKEPDFFFVTGHFSEIIHPDQYHAWLFCQGYNHYRRSSDTKISDLAHPFYSVTMTDLNSVCRAMWGFEDGKHAAEMEIFLNDQKRRSNAGEDLKTMNRINVEDTINSTSTKSAPALTTIQSNAKASMVKPKRSGGYKTAKPEILTYYTTRVKDQVELALRSNREPDKNLILKQAFEDTVKYKAAKVETLRGWLKNGMKDKVYDEIHRAISLYK